ncbi:hypothetical protein LTS08_007793 [Lithohypha guttulata]|uniref:SMP domain-containing protein n=1 Tax=Lithohypha guttulata TaxID=1690604 RepID=A0AAN7YD00_9EURO|nr:hypothetical protein LTR51_007446 [Lithohypha guttulata]KAK5081216.1 hypothetical protein LTR05_008010 [Lithohypha guttulata]KAK5096187.1 hypothetical protein LTS08_007793 [Lithohypha guttulata]
MSDKTYHVTSEDLRKAEAQEAKFHGGQTPKDSDVSAMKQLLSEQESKSDQIDRVKAGLPLPDDPPVAADLQSADGRTVNVGSGEVNVKLGTGGSALREPATAESSARVDGKVYDKNTEP